jgi:hypothetical protein
MEVLLQQQRVGTKRKKDNRRYTKLWSIFLTLIPLSGVGTCFSSCCDKDSATFLRPAACLTSTLLETGVDANDCKCSRDQQLNVPSKAQRSSR